MTATPPTSRWHTVGRACRAGALIVLLPWALWPAPAPVLAQEAQTQPAAEETEDDSQAEPSAPGPETATAPSKAVEEPATAEVEGATTAPSTRPTTTPATAPTTAAATMPTASRPALAGVPMLLNFQDASLRNVLEYLSEAAGLMIVEEAKMDGRVTVMSRQPVSVDEAVALVDTVLRTKGLAAVRSGRILRIISADQAKKDLIPVRLGNDPEKIQPSDRIVTQVIPIRSADAVRLKADIASLIPSTADVATNASSNTLIITSTEAIVRRVVEIIKAIDGNISESVQVQVFQLKYANAASAARLITDIFKEETTGQAAATPFGPRRAFTMPGMPGGAVGAVGGGGETGRKGPKVVASADDRTNTLVVSAAPDVLKVIEGVVKQLDANPAADQAVRLFRLKNAQATNLESILNTTFGWSGTTGIGRTTAQQRTGAAGGGFTTGGGLGAGSTGGRGAGTTGGRGLSTGGTGALGSGQTGATAGGQARGTTAARTFGGGGTTARPSAGTVAAATDLAGQVFVVADPDTNSLLVTTASKNFDRVQAIIEELDRAVPQVLIKVLIAEVTHDNSLDLGMEFSALNLRATGKGFKVGSDFATKGAVTASNSGFEFSLDERYVAAAIRAMANKTALDVLSRPYILTGDNQQASIMVGEYRPFITRSQITDTGQTINTIEYDNIGLILTVTPHINPQGIVTLDAALEISTPGENVPISVTNTGTVFAQAFAKRSAQNRVAVRDGQTIVIGGLMEDRMRDTVDKVPILGDIPGIGVLFRHTNTKKTKTELLLFLTPHVAEQPDDLKAMSKDEQAGAVITPNAVEKGAFQEHLRGLERGAATRPAGRNSPPQPAERTDNPHEENYEPEE